MKAYGIPVQTFAWKPATPATVINTYLKQNEPSQASQVTSASVAAAAAAAAAVSAAVPNSPVPIKQVRETNFCMTKSQG